MGAGSSPLARGLLVESVAPPCEPGIIPARAGFTDAMTGITNFPTDHPRSRGVYGVLFVGLFIGLGSSPLARGLRTTSVVPVGESRIIPARAGFTGPCTRSITVS